MKKVLSVLLSVLLPFCMAACTRDTYTGTENTEPTEKEYDGVINTEPVLVLEEVRNVPDFADFTFKSVTTTNVIEPLMYSSYYYDNTMEGYTFVDTVIELTNRSGAEIATQAVMKARAVNEKGTYFENCFYCVEEQEYTTLSEYKSIKADETVRFHAAVMVPEKEKSLTLCYELNGIEFQYTYTVGNTDKVVEALEMGKVVESEGVGSIEFQGIEYLKELRPSLHDNASYTYYCVEDEVNNTFLAAKFKVTNINGNIEADKLLKIEADAGVEDMEEGFLVCETPDGKMFDNEKILNMNTSCTVYYLVEIPQNKANRTCTINVVFDKKEYVYKK